MEHLLETGELKTRMCHRLVIKMKLKELKFLANNPNTLCC